MTQLNDKDHAAQMADMASFDEEMPSIGIFWYDPNDHSLFGVGKKELTPKMVEEAAEKGIHYMDYSTSSFLHQPSDIKRSACGRVAWNIDRRYLPLALLRIRLRPPLGSRSRLVW